MSRVGITSMVNGGLILPAAEERTGIALGIRKLTFLAFDRQQTAVGDLVHPASSRQFSLSVHPTVVRDKEVLLCLVGQQSHRLMPSLRQCVLGINGSP